MKRLVYLLPLVLLACGSADDSYPKDAAANNPVKTSSHSVAFTSSFQKLLDTYYSLTGSLVDGNDSLAAKLGVALANRADSVNLAGMEKDSTIYETTKAILESVKSEATGLSGEANIENRRKSYQMVSDAMYDLVRTVKYEGQTIYHQFCPMAFNNQGAYWITNSPDIKNPYFGKAMPNCGETKDSLSFGSK
jgi:Cu(I)/Ag(I) efflux system membrane fusion protein